MSCLLLYNFLLSVSTIENSSVQFSVLAKCVIPEGSCRFEYFRVFSPTLSKASNDYSRIVPVRDEEEFLPLCKYIIRNHTHVPGN